MEVLHSKDVMTVSGGHKVNENGDSCTSPRPSNDIIDRNRDRNNTRRERDNNRDRNEARRERDIMRGRNFGNGWR